MFIYVCVSSRKRHLLAHVRPQHSPGNCEGSGCNGGATRLKQP